MIDRKFGIECEFFVFKDDNSPLSLYENKALLDELNKSIKHELLFEIINDSCTHIFEIIFKPTVSIRLFIDSFNFVFQKFQSIIKNNRLNILQESSLNKLVEPIFINNNSRLVKNINRQKINNKLFHKYFGTGIIATQIHIDIDNYWDILPQIYEFEYLFPLLYSKSKKFNGESAYCIRPLIYEQNYHNEYLLKGFPLRFARNQSEYESIKATTKDFIRDYSLIVPREEFGTLEYRTTCSQSDATSIAEIIALRQAIMIIAETGRKRNSKKIFDNVCKTGIVNNEILQNDYNLLIKSIEMIDKQYIVYLKKVLSKVERYLN